MTPRELELLEKKSIYTFRINDGLKESTVNNYLDDLSKKVKKEVKRNELVVIVMKMY